MASLLSGVDETWRYASEVHTSARDAMMHWCPLPLSQVSHWFPLFTEPGFTLVPALH